MNDHIIATENSQAPVISINLSDNVPNKQQHTKSYICISCPKRYKSSQALRNHISLTHNTTVKKFVCNHCVYKCQTYLCLVNHLLKKHRQIDGFNKERFKNIVMATKRLEELLHNGLYSFRKSTGGKHTKEGNVGYYVCNQKTNDVECVCFIKYIYKKGNIEIIFNNEHNHRVDLDKAKLPLEIKNEVVAKMMNDVAINKIYRGVTYTEDFSTISKANAITKNYLRSLKTKYQNELKASNNDLINTREYLKQKKADGILKYYLLKEKNEEIKNFANLKKNFILAYQTVNQYNSILEEESEHVMADATHSTNIYGYILVTFAVLTKKQRFLPFLTIITDSEAEKTITYVMSKFLKNGLLPLTPTYLMSDLSPTYVNCWKKLINSEIVWHYCAWHYKTAILKNISCKIKNKDDKEQVKKKFLRLMKTYDMVLFKKRYWSFVQLVKMKEDSFHSYFITNYDKCVERWAPPYRVKTELNNNMFLESFHGAFKSEFLENRARNRLDLLMFMLIAYDNQRHLIYILSTLSKNSEFSGYREKISKKKHKKSLDINNSHFKKRNQHFYYKKYNIQRGICNGLSNKCRILCRDCGICKDRYTCNCYSFVIKKEQCKHIHMVHVLSGAPQCQVKEVKTIKPGKSMNNSLKIQIKRDNPMIPIQKSVTNEDLSCGDGQGEVHLDSSNSPVRTQSNNMEMPSEHYNEFLFAASNEHLLYSQGTIYNDESNHISGADSANKKVTESKSLSLSMFTNKEMLKNKVKQIENNISLLTNRLNQSNSLIYVNKVHKIIDTLLYLNEFNIMENGDEMEIDRTMLKRPKKQREHYKNK